MGPSILGFRFDSIVTTRWTLTLLACFSLIYFSSCRKENPHASRVQEVKVVQVIQKDVPIVHEWVGTADGLVNATIRAQVTGYLIRQNYKEGDVVKTGQLLFEIDPRSFQAALDQAKGELTRQEAQHANAKANLEEFAKELNLEGLAFDENHTCILGIDNTFSLHLTYEPNSDRLYLYSPILDGLPKEDKVKLKLYEALLEGSMLGGKMAGGGFPCRPSPGHGRGRHGAALAGP